MPSLDLSFADGDEFDPGYRLLRIKSAKYTKNEQKGSEGIFMQLVTEDDDAERFTQWISLGDRRPERKELRKFLEAVTGQDLEASGIKLETDGKGEFEMLADAIVAGDVYEKKDGNLAVRMGSWMNSDDYEASDHPDDE